MGGIRGITIKLNLKKVEIKNNTKLIAEAGTSLIKLSNIAMENELEGLEFATGIPGTLAGAIKMNAGAYGVEIKDILESTTYIDENLEIHTINNKENDFKYRSSRFSKNKNDIIISAVLNLKKGNKEEIKLKMNENVNNRKAKQPLKYPSAGSTFKRGERIYNSRTYRQMLLKRV